MKLRQLVTVFFVALALLLSLPFDSHSQSSFYEGKTIVLVRGGGSGGTGDMRVRAVMPFLDKYIPGRPGLLVKYMPGGGGRLAGNYMFSRARPDGLTIGNIGSTLVLNGYLGARGVRYDYKKFNYLGSGNSKTAYALVVNRKTGLDTMEKLRAAKGLRIGSLGVGHSLYINARLFAWLLDLKEPKFVVGYTGGMEMDLALITEELDIRVNIPDTILRRSRHWIDDKLVYIHVILEVPKGYRLKHPAFDGIPTLESFAKTEKEKNVLAAYRIFAGGGSAFILPPGTPKDRVKILEEAFRKTFQDPEFQALYRKLTGAPATPLTPEDNKKAIKSLPKDPEMIKFFRQIASVDPLPPH